MYLILGVCILGIFLSRKRFGVFWYGILIVSFYFCFGKRRCILVKLKVFYFFFVGY